MMMMMAAITTGETEDEMRREARGKARKIANRGIFSLSLLLLHPESIKWEEGREGMQKTREGGLISTDRVSMSLSFLVLGRHH